MRSPENRLFARFQRTGNTRALGVLFDRVAPDLLKVARYLSGDAALAEDLVQATFMAAIESAGKRDPARPVMPWLVGILNHLAQDARRQEVRRARIVPTSRALAPQPAQVAADAEFRTAFGAALRGLPQPYREVVALHLDDGLRATDIAARVGRSADTACKQLARGLAMLRQALPPSLATALVVAMTPSRGLAAVRTVVLRAAEGAVPAAAMHGVVTFTGGLLLVKKLVFSLVALAILAAVVLLIVPRDEVPPVASASPSDARVAAATPAPAATATPLTRQPALPSPAVGTPGEASMASLLVHVQWSDGAAASGIHARLRPEDAAEPELVERRAVTDNLGNATFVALAPGRWLLATDRGPARSVALAAGEAKREEVQLRAGATCRGSVVNENGEAVTGAMIWLGASPWFDNSGQRGRVAMSGPKISRPAWSEGTGDRASTLVDVDDGYPVAGTDAQGRFELRGLADGAWLWATVVGCQSSALTRAAFDAEVVLRITSAGSTLTGRVLDDATGEPIAGAVVVAGMVVREPHGSPAAFGMPMQPSARARTDIQGCFSLPGPTRASGLVIFARARCGPARCRRRSRSTSKPASSVRLSATHRSSASVARRSPSCAATRAKRRA